MQFVEAMEESPETYLLSRLRDKDDTNKSLRQQSHALKRQLLVTLDWLEAWEREMPKADAFDCHQLCAPILHTLRMAPNIDDS